MDSMNVKRLKKKLNEEYLYKHAVNKGFDYKESYHLLEEYSELIEEVERLQEVVKQEITNNPVVNIGSFTMSSGKMMVSDPCYEIGTWCQYQLDNVKNGVWNASMKRVDDGVWGIRIASIQAHIKYISPSDDAWELVEVAHIGVDSGQAGFYDLDKFDSQSKEWYRKNGDITLSDRQGGVLDGGAVSSSGYGDGGYPLYVIKDNSGTVIAVKVIFIVCQEIKRREYYISSSKSSKPMKTIFTATTVPLLSLMT